MSEEVLRVEGLSVGIGVPAGTLRAVSDVDLHVDRGETLCIVGESGCGKTMTSLGIMGLLPRRAHLAARKLALEGRELLAMLTQSALPLTHPAQDVGAGLIQAP